MDISDIATFALVARRAVQSQELSVALLKQAQQQDQAVVALVSQATDAAKTTGQGTVGTIVNITV